MTPFSKIAAVQSQVWMSEHALTIDSFGPDLVLCVQDDVDQTDSSVWIALLPLHEHHCDYVFSSSWLYLLCSMSSPLMFLKDHMAACHN